MCILLYRNVKFRRAKWFIQGCLVGMEQNFLSLKLRAYYYHLTWHNSGRTWTPWFHLPQRKTVPLLENIYHTTHQVCGNEHSFIEACHDRDHLSHKTFLGRDHGSMCRWMKGSFEKQESLCFISYDGGGIMSHKYYLMTWLLPLLLLPWLHRKKIFPNFIMVLTTSKLVKMQPFFFAWKE